MHLYVLASSYPSKFLLGRTARVDLAVMKGSEVDTGALQLLSEEKEVEQYWKGMLELAQHGSTHAMDN